MSTTLVLNCWILSDDPSHVFPVKIEGTELVGTLKKAIKDEKKPAFDHVPADTLVLWKVSIPFGGSFKQNLGKLDFVDEQSLSPVYELSEVFAESPARRHVHIIVRSVPIVTHPSLHSERRLLELNCSVLGDDDPSHIFPVKIESTELVGTLKKAIKDEKKPAFDHVPADTLVLWNVSIPVHKRFEENLSNLELVDKGALLPVDRLSKFFTSLPEEGHLHIVIKAPRTTSTAPSISLSPSSYRRPTNIQSARKAFFNANPPKPPSTSGKPIEFAKNQEKTTCYFSRPNAASGPIPVTLLHPALGKFVDDCESHVPTKEDNALARDLSLAMSEFFSHEDIRMSKFREVMNEHGFDLRASTVEGSSYRTDGHTLFRNLLGLLVEGKLEIASLGAEPLFQALCYYMEFARKAGESNGPLPCLILYVFGAHIGFAGAVFTDRPNLQVLTTPLPLFWDASDTRLRTIAARHFGALKTAIDSLRLYYEVDVPAMNAQPSMVPDTGFPHQVQYVSLDDHTERHFTYVCGATAKLVFFGKTDRDEDICIKFVRSYSKDAHLYCASKGCAPALRGFERIPGGWFMVVMDVLDESYQRFDCRLPSPNLYPPVIGMVTSLHQAGFVHGDLRDTNVWVKGISTFMFLDFDWSGEIGVVRYPMNIYAGPTLTRPEGAFDGELILAEHDIAMVHIMFNML